MNLPYIVLRLIRRFLPRPIVRALLRRGWFIHPGLETREPKAAAQRYQAVLAQHGVDLGGKSVLVFGYGGRFALAAELLKLGARRVVLNDKFAPPDDNSNRELLAESAAYVFEQHGRVLPNSEFIDLSQVDIREAVLPRSDIVLSTSVFEHLDDVDGIARALAALTKPGGVQLHFVDLRDHYFRDPFEMLCYSQSIWESWLNPTSNLNRYRMRDYRRIFEKYFRDVKIDVLEREPGEFQRIRRRIRAEFLSGDDTEDSVTLIQVLATSVRDSVDGK